MAWQIVSIATFFFWFFHMALVTQQKLTEENGDSCLRHVACTVRG